VAFRPGRVPEALELSRYLNSAPAPQRLKVKRADSSWIHGRDADPKAQLLAQKKIAIIGIGSVGSFVAELLAASGVGDSAIRPGIGTEEQTPPRGGAKGEEVAMANQIEDVHSGSSFDDFLIEEDLHEEVESAAIKRVLAWQFEQEMERQQKTKRAMAKELKTSRSQLARLLDPQNTTVSIETLSRAARVLGKRLVLEIRDQRPVRGARTKLAIRHLGAGVDL
jgi:antitoxin HicB